MNTTICNPTNSESLTIWLAAANTLKAKHGAGVRGSVDIYDREYYENNAAQCILYGTPEHPQAVFAITKSLELVTLIKNPGNKSLDISIIIQHAIGMGAHWLFCVETEKLHNLYTSNGFMWVASLKWNDEQAPEGWDSEKYGKPYVSFYALKDALTSDDRETYACGRFMFLNYDMALDHTTHLINNNQPSNTQLVRNTNMLEYLERTEQGKGDAVTCLNCEWEGLVPVTAETCPC
jgi:hypothetical protein